MGGRGTGKSTILFFLKACLSKTIEDDDEIYQVLQSNLGLGELSMEFEYNENQTLQILKLLNEPPQIKLITSEQALSFDDLAETIECDFYHTNKIASIGVDYLERLKLIDKKRKTIIDEKLGEMKKVQSILFSNAQSIIQVNKQIVYLEEQLTQYRTIEEEFGKHKALTPEGISEHEKAEFEKADSNEKKRDNEKRFINKNIEVLNEVLRNISFSFSELDSYYTKLNGLDVKQIFFNEELMGRTYQRTKQTIEKLKLHLSQIDSAIKESFPNYNSELEELGRLHLVQQSEFVKLKAKFEKRRAYFDIFNSLSTKVAKKAEFLTSKNELETKRTAFKSERLEQIGKLNSLKLEVYKIRQEVVEELNASFAGDVKITLTPGGMKDEFQDKLKRLLTTSGRTYTDLIPRIVERFTPDKFAMAVNDNNIELLKKIDGIDEVRANVLSSMKGKSEIFEIESLYTPDFPIFYLRIIEEGTATQNYKRSEDLSMGQRCTTVLPVVFSVSNNPLIIDQPEDNLDNKYIANRIHDIISVQKNSRQIIFVTHNPNIPVLADSERNVFLKFDGKSDVDLVGTIDEVKDSIIELLEGGKEAFKRRKVKYNL